MFAKVTRAVVGLVLMITVPVENVLAGTVAVLVKRARDDAPAVMLTAARPATARAIRPLDLGLRVLSIVRGSSSAPDSGAVGLDR
jgi:hypothetical protein